MSLKKQVMEATKEALRQKETEKLQCLRFLSAEIKNKEIQVRPKSLVDSDILALIQKLVKQRREGIQTFQDAGRMELAQKEEYELGILQGFLPPALSEEQVVQVVSDVINQLEAPSLKDMGRVMKEIMHRTKGATESQLVSRLVHEKLSVVE